MFPALRPPPELDDDRPEEPEDEEEARPPPPPPPFRFSIARGSSALHDTGHAVSARADSSRIEIATDFGTTVDETTARAVIRVAAIRKSFMLIKRALNRILRMSRGVVVGEFGSRQNNVNDVVEIPVEQNLQGHLGR